LRPGLPIHGLPIHRAALRPPVDGIASFRELCLGGLSLRLRATPCPSGSVCLSQGSSRCWSQRCCSARSRSPERAAAEAFV
jgi:hypothetical protein